MARGVQIGGFSPGTRARFNGIKEKHVIDNNVVITSEQLLVGMMDLRETIGDADPALLHRVAVCSHDNKFKTDLINLLRQYESRATRG